MKNLSAVLSIILLFFLISCKKETAKKQEDMSIVNSANDSINQEIIRSLGEVLTPETKIKIANWTDYLEADEFIENFYAMSAYDVLNNAEVLKGITQVLKDSIKDEQFKKVGIKTRLNVLHNSALRLVDMSKIPTISTMEVNQETQNMLEAFSSLNAKLNNITNQELLEAQVKEIETILTDKN